MAIDVNAALYVPTPDRIRGSQMTEFANWCGSKTGQVFADYPALQAFSLREPERFWSLLLEWADLAIEGDLSPSFVGKSCEEAEFFPKIRLNYAENLLRSRTNDDDAAIAVTACDELGQCAELKRGELRRRVLSAAASLRELGVQEGDRVVAIARNTAESAVAALATVALGAVWSSISPDLGADAALDRLRPLQPKVLFCHTRYPYQGAERDISDRITTMANALSSISAVVVLGTLGTLPTLTGARVHAFEELERHEPLSTFPRFGWNHPLFILFSSGTTGAPKCIVHGTGGTLLEHVKELRLHTDLRRDDTLFFQTSCGWMMWNWQLSALATGASIVLYDGSVAYPEQDSLWQLVSAKGVSVFGTSPAYLQFTRDAGIVPAESVRLERLRAILSTGSILRDDLFSWAFEHVKSVPIQSISGGTDIIGCFALGNPNLPVFTGELQCISLGMDVRSVPDGQAVGELICANPFPSRPLGLYGDSERARFHEAYFSQNPGVWTHGDFLEITSRSTVRIHGRSDGILNIRGIRIGPSEIYRVLEDFGDIREAMAIEQRAANEPGGSRLVLLVVMSEGKELARPLMLRIKKQLSEKCSMAHVPAVMVQVNELPMTHNGKRSERAARDAIHGRVPANLGALRNPDCLRALAEHPELRVS